MSFACDVCGRFACPRSRALRPPGGTRPPSGLRATNGGKDAPDGDAAGSPDGAEAVVLAPWRTFAKQAGIPVVALRSQRSDWQ